MNENYIDNEILKKKNVMITSFIILTYVFGKLIL